MTPKPWNPIVNVFFCFDHSKGSLVGICDTDWMENMKLLHFAHEKKPTIFLAAAITYPSLVHNLFKVGPVNGKPPEMCKIINKQPQLPVLDLDHFRFGCIWLRF